MAAPLLQALIFRDNFHYLGDPLSLEELENTPHLKASAKAIRDLYQTNRALRDIEFQNNEEYATLTALLNNDFIFRLKFNHEYYLLSELFKDPNKKALLIKYLKEVHAKELEAYQRELQASSVIRPNPSNVTLGSAANQVVLHWTHPDPNASNSEKLQHYENELQRITTEHQTHRVRVRNNSINRDFQQETGYIDRMMRELRRNHPEERQAIAKLDAIKQDVLNKRQVIMNVTIRKLDGSVDLLATSQHQDEEMEQLQKDYITRIEDVLSRVQHHPALNALRAERAVVLEQDAEEIREIDRIFEEQKAQLTTYIEQARRAVAKDEAVHQLGKIIDAANLCEVDEHQKETLKNSIKELEHSVELLEKTEDWATVQTIMQGCKTELAQIKEIIPEIRHEIEALDKLVVEPVWMQSPPPAYNEMDIEPQQPREPISLTEVRGADSRQSETQEMATAQSTVDDTQDRSTPSNSMQNAAPISEEDLDSRREEQERFRAGVRSPEKQRKIALQDISSRIENFVDDENADERLRALAITMQTQIVTIRGHANYQEVPYEIKKSFATALEEFGLADEEFNDFKNKYAPMFEPSEPPPYQANYNP